MKKKSTLIASVLLCILTLLTAEGARALPEADELIAVSFRMLEADNPFIPRFEARSGRKVDIMFPQGMPYLFGNPYSIHAAFNNYPDYLPYIAPSNSGYFKKDGLYFYGTDCTGFIRYINKDCNKAFPPDTLTNMMYYGTYQWSNHLFNNLTKGREAPEPDRLRETLEVGDYLILHHTEARYFHIAMYIGTLSDFGYTAEEEPELAPYLDYPLVIHCGLNPVYGARFQKLIDDYPEKYGLLTTTDGGVAIAIVGVEPEKVPFHEHVQQTDYDYFVMNDGGYVLTNMDLSDTDAYCWFRQYW